MSALYATYACILGAIIGSFLNVVIHRLPRGESLLFPASRCPSCQSRIRPWDNIPLLSWLILRGRCRSCRAPISLRYPLVEASNAIFYLAIILFTGPTLLFLLVAAIVSMTIALIFIDLDIQILPDVIDLPGIVVGLAIGAIGAHALVPELTLARDVVDSAIGAALGAGSLYLVAVVYRLIRREEGMGLGDVKMLAMIGAVVGWRPLFPTLFLASLVGAVFGVALAVVRRSDLRFAVPFGVFLGLALLTVIFFGEPLTRWYLGALLY